MIDTTVLQMVRSQVIIWDGSKYRMWYTGGEAGSVVSYNEISNGITWTSYTPCIGIASCWYLDILNVGNKYFLTNYELQGNNNINRLRLHESTMV